MENEMVERAAKAIYERRNGSGCRAWASLPDAHRGPYRTDARAAMEAIREPSGPMVTSGSNAEIATWNGKGNTFADDPTPVWTAMIDAALQ